MLDLCGVFSKYPLFYFVFSFYNLTFKYQCSLSYRDHLSTPLHIPYVRGITPMTAKDRG